MIRAKIIQDSINAETSDRLTTFVVEFPRFVNAELLRHRVLSFCSASSRAVPQKKLAEDVINNPAIPVFWGKNQSGMQAAEELDDLEPKPRRLYKDDKDEPLLMTDREYAKRLWLDARFTLVGISKKLAEAGLHKQICNRVLESHQNIRLIISGTEWENFFALRAHMDAQPEISALAYQMLKEYNKSRPEIKYPTKGLREALEAVKKDGAPFDIAMKNRVSNETAHIPFGDRMEGVESSLDKVKIAAARCARISYNTYEGDIDQKKDIKLFERLIESTPVHASPAEHVAFPVPFSETGIDTGNFKGWVQLRKFYAGETSSDERVKKYKVVDGRLESA